MSRRPPFAALDLFCQVAHHSSFADAATELNLSKGAISQRMLKLEEQLGFALFNRTGRGVELTQRAIELRHACEQAFGDMEAHVNSLKASPRTALTIGMSTYIASRWLSARLMNFINAHPEITLRLQSTVGPVSLKESGIDLLIRWGKGQWQDVEIESMMPLPAYPTGNTTVLERIAREGLHPVLESVPLLHDFDGSEAWKDWFDTAGIDRPNRDSDLIINDPNVRVQTLIAMPCIALNDDLVSQELDSGELCRLSNMALENYGYYLAYNKSNLENPAIADLRRWLLEEAAHTPLAMHKQNQ